MFGRILVSERRADCTNSPTLNSVIVSPGEKTEKQPGRNVIKFPIFFFYFGVLL